MSHAATPLLSPDQLSEIIQQAIKETTGTPIEKAISTLLPLVTLFLAHCLYLGIRYVTRVERHLSSHRSHSRERYGK
jgi:hypothetical protein